MKPRNFLNALLSRWGYKVVKFKLGRPNAISWLDDVRTLLPADSPVTILDIGANRGQSAESYHALFPQARILSSEPDPEAFRALADVVARLPKAQAFQLAFGESRGTASFNRFQSSQTNSFLAFDSRYRTETSSAVVKVTVETLDSFCGQLKIQQIDLLKIDTQGYDLKVLRGGGGLLGRKAIKLVLTELLFSPQYLEQPCFAEFDTFLRSYGYRLLGFYGQSQKGGQLNSCDACWVA